MQVSWISIPAILLSFIYIFVPVFLWLTDRIFRKPLGSRLFIPTWNKWMILLAICLWIADRFWVYFSR